MPCRQEIICPEWREVPPNAIYIRNGTRLVPDTSGAVLQQTTLRADVKEGNAMGRAIKTLLILVIFGFIGLTGYAYLADLSPEQQEVIKPVVLNAGD
jgi:hypothetical protein